MGHPNNGYLFCASMLNVNTKYFYSDNETVMQDLGYHENFDTVDFVPDMGYTKFICRT